jgi:hypothetical protein
MRRKQVPDGAEVIRSYEDYGNFVRSFFGGYYQLLIVLGKPGLGKTQAFKEYAGDNAHITKGWTSPLQAYIDAYHHRNKLLIYDDAETLWQRSAGRVFMRSICESQPIKDVQWASTSSELKRLGIPQHFRTSSKVAIIANHFTFGREDELQAVLDRGHLIYFDPIPVEVHTRVGDWFWDQQVYDFVGDRLHMLAEVSSRTYVKAWERRRAGSDWRKMIIDQYCLDSTKLAVQELEVDQTCKSVQDRVDRFMSQTGRSRATYFNVKRALQQSGQLNRVEVRKRVLRGTPPDYQAEPEEPGHDPPTPDGTGVTGSPVFEAEDDPADWWKKPRPEVDGEEKIHQVPDVEFGHTRTSWLHREMQKAIEREDYERAAELRDRIREIEEQEGE